MLRLSTICRRLLLLGTGCIVVLSGLPLMVVHTGLVRRFAIVQLQTRLGNTTGLVIEAKEFDYDLLAGTVKGAAGNILASASLDLNVRDLNRALLLKFADERPRAGAPLDCRSAAGPAQFGPHNLDPVCGELPRNGASCLRSTTGRYERTPS